MSLAGHPSTRAQVFATRLEAANRALLEVVEACSDADWQTVCPAEGRRVGVVAHHVGASYLPVLSLVQAVASGQPAPPLTMEMVHRSNAQHADENAACTREETRELLRRNGAEAERAIGALSDEQLKRTALIPAFGDKPVSVQWLIENIMIGHCHDHLHSIRWAIGG